MVRCAAIAGAAISFALAAAGGGATAAAPASSTPIAYIGKGALYAANADGSNRQLIARGVSDRTTFSWSPDGQRIAFTREYAREQEIFVVNADGSDLKQLTHAPSGRKRTIYDWSENPSWSPDGKLIAFDGATDETDGIPQIFLIRSDGTGRRRLTGSLPWKGVPTWSPGGREILFEQWLGKWVLGSFVHDGRIDLYVMQADGSGRRKVARVRNERGHCACAAWSPDATKIAYDAAGASGKPDIYVMQADGTGPVRLTRSPARDENPDWSSDGMQIAFYSERPGNAEIYIMSSDGTDQQRVTHDPWYDEAVRWKPAG